jgi:uncharacterized repeat protein (TIGR03803 family)
MRSEKACCAAKSIFVIFIMFMLASAIVPTQAQAGKFKVLHTFKGGDGSQPDAQLVRDSLGNLYGTTGEGGTGKCSAGCGTAFKMDKNGKLIWLHSFLGGKDGWEPYPGLMRDASGNLYGTTTFGGTTNHFCSQGCGVVFKLDKEGKETILHRFTADPDGYYPVGPLVRDKAGNLYGGTQLGGKDGAGAVFNLTPSDKETILYSFTFASDGAVVDAGVILDGVGNLYGTTFDGGDLNCVPGSGCGVVFKIDAAGGETVLHTFEGSDGAGPTAPLLLDPAGNLYGTTKYGGNLGCRGGEGCGIVFELSPNSDGTWTETVLYEFCSQSSCADGQVPGDGDLVRDASGNLYGTTVEGGIHTSCSGGSGCGVVFKLDTGGGETVLHNFTGGTDGYYPLVGVTRDASGNLYGTALFGGAHGAGILFKISP